MADGFSTLVNKVTSSLSSDESKILLYLCTDLFNNSCVEELRGDLLAFAQQNPNQAGQTHSGNALLMELMFQMKRYDLLRKVFGTNKQQVEGILRKERVISDYRVLMADVSENLDKEDLQSLIFLLSSILPKERSTRATSFLDVVVELEKLNEVSCEKLDFLEKCLKNIRRNDLVKKIQAYRNRGQNMPCAAPNTFKFTPMQCQPFEKQVRQSQCFNHEFNKLKLSVPETGIHYQQAITEEYQMNPDQRGLCVIIDCVGYDGEMLKHTFECLGFKVIFHSLLGLKETQKVLEDLSLNRILQRVRCFVCCLISRGTNTHLLATDSNRLGINLKDLKQLFNATKCPKIFFTQLYRITEAPVMPSIDDEYLETDAPASRQCSNTGNVPMPADVLWSVCTAEVKLLEESGHQSVYLNALNNALLKGHERNVPILDVMKEVQRNVLSHDSDNYQLQQSHTLQKKLYL